MLVKTGGAVMKKLYGTYTEFRDRVLIVYIFLSIFVCTYYTASFLISEMYKPAILQLIGTMSMFIALGLLYAGKLSISRIWAISTAYILVALQSFLFFSPVVGFHYQYIALLVVAFTVYNGSNRASLIKLLLFTILLLTTFIVIDIFSIENTANKMQHSVEKIYFYTSIVGTFLGLYIVMMFFSMELSRTKQQLQHMAEFDFLTNLNNRRSLLQYGSYIFKLAAEHQQIFSVLLFDIDHFKKVNDSFGHAAGDMVLKEVCQLIKKTFRDNDYSARYGGEEFAVVLLEANAEKAMTAAEKIRKVVEEHVFFINEQQSIQLTISIGICVYNRSLNSFDQVLNNSDNALYEAKENGRNCIRMFNAI